MSRPDFLPRLAARLWALLLAALLAFPVGHALAAPLGQDTPAEPLLLGQYAYQPLVSGESRVYEVTIPESGAYLVTAVDAEAAANAFDVVVTDAAGTVLYDDIFENVELDLEPGVLTLEFIAVEDGELWFVVLGQIGSMTEDAEQPGKLNTGSVYTEEGVSETRYGLLTVPETTYPQQVLIYVEPGEEDSFFVSAEGEGAGYVSMSTDDNTLLSFWTHGGDYLIGVEPMARRSAFTLIAFLSGRPTPITVDSPVEAVVPAGATQTVFELELDTTFDNLTLDVQSDAGLGVRLVDHYYTPEVDYNSFGEPSVEIPNLFPGVYYIFVEASEAAAEDTPFTLSVAGAAGQALGVLESGVAAEGSFEAGQASTTYTFEVAQPGAMVEVLLESTSQETDFDISAGLRPGAEIWYTYVWGSNEALHFVAPVAGTYYVTVKSNDGVGDYAVTATEGELAPALENNAITWDTVEARGRNVYRMEVTEPGQLLVLAMVGSPEVDLDLQIAAYNANGDQVAYASGATGGSVEVATQLLTEPGIYEISVTSYFYDDSSNYFLNTVLMDASLLGGQWAIEAAASSQYGEEGFAATQATGPTNTFAAGDFDTAWASSESDAGEETLELVYAYPVTPYGVEIVESYNPGAVVAIELYDAANDAWVTAWQGEAAATEEAYRVNLFQLDALGIKTDRIRLVLDTAAVPGFNEIDAVQLFGRP
jgi:hypothetical protein